MGKTINCRYVYEIFRENETQSNTSKKLFVLRFNYKWLFLCIIFLLLHVTLILHVLKILIHSYEYLKNNEYKHWYGFKIISHGFYESMYMPAVFLWMAPNKFKMTGLFRIIFSLWW